MNWLENLSSDEASNDHGEAPVELMMESYYLINEYQKADIEE
ncbi:hypothetical protein ACWJJH_09280 [Endozoicomonadaceae bacterium StTr2]